MSDALCEKVKHIGSQNNCTQSSTFRFTKTAAITAGLHQAQKQNAERRWRFISLAECLDASTPERYYLSHKDRLHLAVNLASSVLQLHGSEWMTNIPRSRDVFFVMNNEGYPVYQHPLLIKGMASTPKSVHCEGLFEPIFASLGVLLIELFLGATMPVVRERNSTTGADWQVAQQLLDRGCISSLNSKAAVSHCFDGFGAGKDALDLADGCHDVYAGIVSLLEKDLDYV